MSQIFHLHPATDTLATDARQLGVTLEALESIRVVVSAHIVTQPSAHLQLSYHITLPTQSMTHSLDWPRWRSDQVGFVDNLWTQTCLECFISGDTLEGARVDDQRSSYIEINASPDGRYALYQFTHYRSPTTQPPVPLLQADKRTLATIHWDENAGQPVASIKTAPPALLSTAHAAEHLKRCFCIPITPLPHQRYAAYGTVIARIHPCVILCLGNTTLYFASRHTSPPDFHDQNCWTVFQRYRQSTLK